MEQRTESQEEREKWLLGKIESSFLSLSWRRSCTLPSASEYPALACDVGEAEHLTPCKELCKCTHSLERNVNSQGTMLLKVVTSDYKTLLCDKNHGISFWFNIVIKVSATKLLQSPLTLYNPIDGSPPGSPIPGILQARILEWVSISFSSAWPWKVKVKLLSHVRLVVNSWAAAYQAPPSIGFFRQEYWSGLPFASWVQTGFSGDSVGHGIFQPSVFSSAPDQAQHGRMDFKS